MRQEGIVDKCCLVPVAPGGVSGPCGGVTNHGYLEAVFEEVP